MEENNNSITLSDLINVLWKNIILAGIITLSILIVGIIYTFGIAKEKYTSTSTVVVALDAANSDSYDYTNSLRIVTTVAELVKQDIVLDKAASTINNVETSTLKGMVSTSYSTTSLLVQIKVTGTDKTKTKEYANTITNSLIEVANSEDYKFINNAVFQTTPAKEGSYTSPNKKLYVLVSFVLGAVVSFGVIFVKEFLSNKFKDKKDIENTLDEKIIGVFPNNKELNDSDTFELVEPNIRNLEPYNKLFNNIKYSNLDNPYKVIMITSTIANELKSTTLVNLASCMVYNNKKVVIIDLDTRKPVIHKFFKTSKENGLVDYIEGSIKRENLVKKTKSGIDIITFGKKLLNPSVVFESKTLAAVIEELKQEYDYVLIDTPPVLACSESQTISKLCDGIIYNIGMNQTKKNDVKDSLKVVKFANKNVIGVCLTKYPVKGKNDYYYYNYQYTEEA